MPSWVSRESRLLRLIVSHRKCSYCHSYLRWLAAIMDKDNKCLIWDVEASTIMLHEPPGHIIPYKKDGSGQLWKLKKKKGITNPLHPVKNAEKCQWDRFRLEVRDNSSHWFRIRVTKNGSTSTCAFLIQIWFGETKIHVISSDQFVYQLHPSSNSTDSAARRNFRQTIGNDESLARCVYAKTTSISTFPSSNFRVLPSTWSTASLS